MRSSVDDARERLEQLDQPFALAAGQAGGRFVEHDQVRIGDEREADLELALLAVREVTDHLVQLIAEPDPFARPTRLFAHLRVVVVPPQRQVAPRLAGLGEVQVVLDREAGQQPRLLIGAGHAELRPQTRRQ